MTNPLSKIAKLVLALALLLALAPALRQDRAAATSNPCSQYPGVCRYTYEPATGCCISDPRFDCYDVCP